MAQNALKRTQEQAEKSERTPIGVPVKDFSEMAGVKPHTVYVWLRTGVVNGVRVGPRKILIPESELDRITSPVGLNAYQGK